MAYRYFIAVNNPVVQKLELKPYEAFYQGIYKVYDEWAEVVGDDMPLPYSELKPQDEDKNKTMKRDKTSSRDLKGTPPETK